MSESIASVYSEARSEYTKQLCTFLVPAYFKFFLGQLDRAREMSTSEPRKFLWHFQSLLNEVPDWNMEKVSTEINKLQTASGCDYLEDLLTAVFIAHTKVLTAIRVNSKQKKVQITVPKVEHFLFKALCESAKLLWGSTFLFRENATSVERQQNYRTIEGLIAEGVTQAVRAMVPVKSILKDFMSIGGDDEEEGAGGAGADAGGGADADDDDEDDAEEKEVEEKPVKRAVEEKAETKEEAKPVETNVTAPSSANPVIEPPTAALTVTEGAQTVLNALAELVPALASASASAQPPTIVVDTRGPSVGFTDFDAILDTDDPEGSDIVHEPKEGKGEEDDEEGLLEILDEEGTPLETEDFEDLDAPAKPQKPAQDDSLLQFDSGEVEEL
jgi:hypothetical protein